MVDTNAVNNRLFRPGETEPLVAELTNRRNKGEKIVFTNGCFDILHIGHARYLAEARALGDLLIVGLNSDTSVQKLKGETRPIVLQAERGEMLLALKAVDYVAIFNEQTPIDLIKAVKPHLLVKGGDWAVEQIVGHEFVASIGGETRSLPFVPGQSTTEIIDRVAQALAKEALAKEALAKEALCSDSNKGRL